MNKATHKLENSNETRVDRYLASMGVSARRNIESVLKEKVVTIDGKRIFQPGIRFDPATAVLLIDGKPLQRPNYVYYALNKPKGVVSTASDEMGRKTVVQMVNAKERIYPVGRLDQNTTGLILLTNDGDLANRLTHPRYHIPKTYHLLISGVVHKDQIKNFQNGVQLSDGLTSKAEVTPLSINNKESKLEVVLHEGKKRQIRRMCESLKLPLLELQRTKVGPVTLENLELGTYRKLTDEEVRLLKKQAGLLE